MDEPLTPHLPDVPNRPTINARKPIETGDSSNKYFETMGKLQEAISKQNYEKAARFTRENIDQISAFVRNTKQEYGTFDISSIPALEQGGTMLALEEDDKGLKEMRRIVMSTSELKPWNSFIDRHEEDMRLFKAIIESEE